jgi:thioredoxin-dependent peroxiredoxin
MVVTFNGKELNLEGNSLKIGDEFPDFRVVDTALSQVTLADTEGVRVFLTVPSIDTGVCDAEVKKFNNAINQFGKVSIYTVSMDLPFAQSKWCISESVKNVKILSDYQNRSFSMATGTLIKELLFTSRAIFVVNSENKVHYVDYIAEVTEHPKYEEVFEAIRKCK